MAERTNGRLIALYRRLLAVWLFNLVNFNFFLHYLQTAESFRNYFAVPSFFIIIFLLGVAEGPEGLSLHSQCIQNATLILGLFYITLSKCRLSWNNFSNAYVSLWSRLNIISRLSNMVILFRIIICYNPVFLITGSQPCLNCIQGWKELV